MADTRSDRNGRPAAAERELSLTPEQALALAIERHQLDELDDAEMIYAALLERWPDHPDVLNHMGVLQHQRGENAAALALLRRAVEVAPDVAGIWNNLGNVLKHEHDDEAERAFRRSLELAESPQALSNLASLLRRRRQWAEGEAACRRAIEIAPAFGDAWHHLTLLLVAQDGSPEAMVAASRATVAAAARQAAPRLVHARARQRRAHRRRGRAVPRMAGRGTRQRLRPPPSRRLPRRGAPERASDAYVEQAFDEFAASFDSKLTALGYRAPALVAEALAATLPAPARQLDIADLGCGTGLCGPLVAPWARRLSGCDLSAAMLELAQRRAVYDQLDKAELLVYLPTRPERSTSSSRPTRSAISARSRRGRAARRARRIAHGGPPRLHGRGLARRRRREPPVASARPVRARARATCAPCSTAPGFARQRIVADVLRSEGGLPVRGWVVSAGRE